MEVSLAWDFCADYEGFSPETLTLIKKTLIPWELKRSTLWSATSIRSKILSRSHLSRSRRLLRRLISVFPRVFVPRADFSGGVTLLRAAAKNHSRVTVLSDPNDYPTFLEEFRKGDIGQETRNLFALKVPSFALTSS